MAARNAAVAVRTPRRATLATGVWMGLWLMLGDPGAGPRAAPPPATPPPAVAAEQGSVAPLVDRVKGAVVTIQSTKIIRRVAVEDPWNRMLREQFGLGGPPQGTRERQEALGSGFIVDKAGLILTNNHVVAGADEVLVKLGDNRELSARVLGSDPATDVAVVKLEKPPKDLQAATLGDSDRVRVGDYVLAIGNPLGLGQTVTMGIVSAKNRVIGEKLGDVDPRYEDFIQTDAAINQGNSGGPLYNFRGEVIAINSAIINPGVAMNVGFAIPINLARQIADQIRRSGKVARGYLGVGGEDFTLERAEEMHVPYAPGALINVVGRGSPAEAAGLRPNDVIIEIAGKPIEGYRRLPAAVGLLRPGEKAKVVFLRAGKRAETVVVLGAQGGGEAQVGQNTFLGVQVRPLDQREAHAVGLRPGEGLAVIAVDPRGPASGVIEEGDVFLELDRHPVTLPRLQQVEARLARGARAALVIQRGQSRFVLKL
jgi:Do/DeqQ family serine protease